MIAGVVAGSAFCALSFLSSCRSLHDTAAVDVNPAGWHDAAVLVYRCVDTLTSKEATLVLRHGPEAQPRKGVYVVEALSPSGVVERDTLDIALSTGPTGNNLHETRAPFRTGVRFAEEGDYVFKVTPPGGTSGIWSLAIDFRSLATDL
jgi:hypothetical protein